jgi:D-3-phosphoglycerate dehydrogenase
MIKVLVCDPILNEGIEELKQAGFEVDIIPKISNSQLKRIVSNYDALIVRGRTKVTKEIIEMGKRLKVIARAGVGLENINVKTAEKKGIIFLNTPEASADAVAELTIGLMISLTRNVLYADRTMKEGKWIKKELKVPQLKGKILGLIGLGNIGLKVARIAKALGMKIIITKRTMPPHELLNELEAEYFPIREFSNFLRKDDIITIHAPLTPQTHHMIGAKEIRNMKDGAFLINTSRGEIVDETALFEALRSGKLGGAALDVFENEPPTFVELMRLPNVVCTPHIGGQTLESQRAISITLAKKLVKLLKVDQDLVLDH